MGGSIRQSGIPYHPADMVPAKHGGTAMANLHENEPPVVFYDKDGIVQDKPKVSKPTVSNAKRVSTLTVSELRALAKARKAPASPKKAPYYER